MGIILTLLAILGTILYLVYYTYSNEGKPTDIAYRPTAVKNAVLIVVPIMVVLTMVGVIASFNSYCSLKEKRATVQQYKVALDLYVAKANIPTGVTGKIISDLTDQKYEGYQLKLSDHIKSYRDSAISYNKLLVSKTIWNDSWYFGWFIIGPDTDMELIELQGGTI